MRQPILMMSLGLVMGRSLAAPLPGQNPGHPNDPCSPYWQGPPPAVPCDRARPAKGRAGPPRAGETRSGMGQRRGIEKTDIRRDK